MGAAPFVGAAGIVGNHAACLRPPTTGSGQPRPPELSARDPWLTVVPRNDPAIEAAIKHGFSAVRSAASARSCSERILAVRS